MIDEAALHLAKKKKSTSHKSEASYNVREEHSYVTTDFVEVESSRTVNYGWKEGRCVVEFAVCWGGG